MPAEPLIACHECDLLQREIHLPKGGVARCRRCGATLFRSHPESLDRALALTLGALFLFVIANAYPIVGLEINGEIIQATLPGTVQTLYRNEMALVAGLLFFTTLLTPLLQMLAMLHLLLPLRFARLPQNASLVFRLLVAIQPWVMVEVFVLGALVSLVKLAHMATVIPGVALWSFGGLMILLAAASTSFDTRQLWAKLEAAS
jgi:paraquat-inducible protein A